jgi:hypothetical protein
MELKIAALPLPRKPTSSIEEQLCQDEKSQYFHTKWDKNLNKARATFGVQLF